MNSLSDIVRAKVEASGLHAEALLNVCIIAETQPEGKAAVATLEGYQRELEALAKLELDIISHGKPTEPLTA